MRGRVILAGALLGVLAYMVSRASAQADAAGGDVSGIAAAVNGLDNFVFETVGYRVMGNWIDDLNGRGAKYAPALAAAEVKYGIPQYMLARLAWQESRFRADIISGKKKSSAGALGIMQIVPSAHPGVDALNATAAIDYAGRYLAKLYGQFGTWELALKAYNWGPGNVRKWLAGTKSQPLETQNYSAQILADISAATGVSYA